MITLTRLDGSKLTLNAQMIETMEANPDTLITMYTDKKFIVKENIEEIIEKVIEYNRKIFLEKTRTQVVKE